MSKVSRELSKRTNAYPVGLKGGRGPSDINNKNANIRKSESDMDRDGSPDYGVSRELSEDTNAKLLKGRK